MRNSFVRNAYYTVYLYGKETRIIYLQHVILFLSIQHAVDQHGRLDTRGHPHCLRRNADLRPLLLL